MVTITGVKTRDVRFPTSLDKTGSDAMNAAGDYSAAYCILETDSEYQGHGMVSCIFMIFGNRQFRVINTILLYIQELGRTDTAPRHSP